MFLSDEQMSAVNHGLPNEERFEWVEVPVGPQPLPAWAKDLHITWMEGYANAPHITIKTNDDLRSWPDKRFEKDGARYMARHPDGRAEVYYHSGPIALRTLQRWSREKQALEDYQALATTQQAGFGGDKFPIVMGGKGELRGQTVILCGPWHGGAPAGYVEAAYVDLNAKWRGKRSSKGPWSRSKRFHRPWFETTGMGGLFITEDLFLRLLARFEPTCRAARVTLNGRTRLQPVRSDWDAPKHWVGADSRRAAA